MIKVEQCESCHIHIRPEAAYVTPEHDPVSGLGRRPPAFAASWNYSSAPESRSRWTSTTPRVVVSTSHRLGASSVNRWAVDRWGSASHASGAIRGSSDRSTATLAPVEDVCGERQVERRPREQLVRLAPVDHRGLDPDVVALGVPRG